ncbi:MAG: DUF1565 domain-containing protein, partial [Candidatus Hydrogenedentes bacterium]|nr:DUF1565 domain-containing protein [Candidatus Hydrogenedentota bacterium]
MIFGPVSPVKGNHCIIVALVLTLAIGTFAGVASLALPAEAAALPPAEDAAPILLYGVSEAEVHAGDAAKTLGMRRQEIVFDAGVLSSIVETKTAAGVLLALFEDVQVQVDIERFTESLQGLQSFSGRVVDRENGHFLMSVDDQGRALLRIETLDEGFIYIVALEPGSDRYFVSEFRAQDLRAPGCGEPQIPVYGKSTTLAPPVLPAIGDDVTVDVLVVYTPAADLWARTHRTGVDNLLAQSFQRGNDSLEDSDVDLRLRLVHTQPIAYQETEDYISDLFNITFTSDFNPFELDSEDFQEQVHDWRDEYGADLVMLLNLASVSNSGIAGVSWLLMTEAGGPEWGFLVVSAEYAEGTLIHEIGHNLGCHHSRAQSVSPAPPEGGLFEYSTGWRWTALNEQRYTSIMTYQEFDYDTLQLDTEVHLFSNPDISYAGEPTGSYVGEYAPADNARTIRESKNIVAGYRLQVVPDSDEGEGEDDNVDPEPDAIWYVNTYSPHPTQDGATWESPFKTIAQALAVASDNHEIWVARGLYQEGPGAAVVPMLPGVRLYGGFIGLEASKLERDVFKNPTVLDGDNDRPAVIGADGAVLDGFMVVNGGMRNDGVSLVVRNCAFGMNEVGLQNTNAFLHVTDCYFGRDSEDISFFGMPDWGTNAIAIQNDGGALTLKRTGIFNSTGIAMLNDGSDEIIIQDCTFKLNRGGGAISNVDVEIMTVQGSVFFRNSAPRGGAIDSATSTVYIAGSSFVNNRAVESDGGAVAGGVLFVDGSSFRENIAVGNGGAIAVPEVASEIRNARFTLNQAGGEGGALMLAADILVENCLVYANNAGENSEGASVSVETGAPVIWNTTFAKNFGYALHNMTAAAAPILSNCIIYTNANAIQNSDNAAPVVTYSNVQGGVEGQGNIDEVPFFRDILNGDMYLAENSPCIDAGTDTGAPIDDIVGVERPQDSDHDMGAWEYVGAEGGDSGEGPSGGDPTEGENEGEDEGEDEDNPTASFEVVSMVRDKEALLPLHNWAPLLRIVMKYGEDEFAPRDLKKLVYTLINDTDDEDDRALEYAVVRDLHSSDILEFGLFWDGEDEDAINAEDVDFTAGALLLTWDNDSDFVTLTNSQEVEGKGHAPLTYEINFLDAPYIPDTGPETDDEEGHEYIIAIRTSATWRSQLTLGIEVLNAEMINPDTGEMPSTEDEEGLVEYTDDYSPDFHGEDEETLEAEVWYSSSFAVFDPSGPHIPSGIFEDGTDVTIPMPNFWQHTSFMAMPTGEFTRPRWNKPGQFMSMFASEYIEERRILALEEWTSVIGINLHSTRGVNDPEEGSILRRVNMILTDVGADPYGPEGNGGFNPKNALKPVGSGRTDGSTFGHHAIHNGIWCWRDIDNNGFFQQPTPNITGGAEINNDRPLPGVLNTAWEYIPFPPGGGDPWWKISILFAVHDGDDYSYISPQPNNVFPDPSDYGKFGSEFTYDYHVVTRFDSGFRDCSLKPATNTGATYGAEFRAFIEPKRLDPFTNTYTGGIQVSSQIPLSEFLPGDDQWMPNEPWWPERTLNATAAKPYRLGVEVHDLVLTYNSSLNLRSLEDLDRYLNFNFHPLVIMGDDFEIARLLLGHSPINNSTGNIYSLWLDRFDQNMAKFTNGHLVSTYKFVPLEFRISATLFGEPYVLYTQGWGRRQYAFETAPFYKYMMDLPPEGPRSAAYPNPPVSPLLPRHDTWPGLLQPGEYPAITDWSPEDASTRLLTQKTEFDGSHVPMLGINVSGSNDPIVNSEGNAITVAQIVVAFWGPDFTPEMLKSLDPDGNDNQSLDSGVVLWEKGEFGIGTPISFLNSQELANYGDTPVPLMQTMVPVTGLSWAGAPEYVDLNGDGLPNDLDGNAILDDADKAWVLTLFPRNQWQLPDNDDLDAGDGGCDLFISASTSESIGRFQQFRAVVPATLPARAEGRRKAGIQFYPPVNTGSKAFLKANGEEDPVAPYYGHDMLQTNIPLRIEDMAQGWSDIYIGGAAVPALGLNIATNHEGTVASGTAAVGYDRGLSVPGQRWTSGSLVGDFLVDNHYESYEITGNTENTLTLLSGTPEDGVWRVVQDPSFLEEVTVELYQEGDFATMNPLTDLLPLDIDQRISGIALYRDNDNHSGNRNGLFDPDIDIPLSLDTAPRFSGRTADELKVRFVFSTPGGNDFPLPRAEQSRNRQWVHDHFGVGVSDPENGPDFFVVLRAATNMQLNDNFRVGIVSWGPNTPTEPDPHIWANLAGEERNDYLKFREFPWGERGVGFISYFKEPPLSYFLHGAKASQHPDMSGVNWIRSHSAQKRRSGTITGRERPLGPQSLIIESASQSRLPIQTLPGQGFQFLIYGDNFGNDPRVVLSGYDVIVNSAKNDTISVTISTRADQTPQEPITLVVRNSNTGDEASRSDLFSLTSDMDVYGPKIMRVTPPSGRKEDFPVIVEGMDFFNASSLEVRFGETRMPILEVSADGTAITVGFPVGGMPQTGMLDVFVASGSKDGGENMIMNGFEYINPESRPKVRFFGCAPVRDAGSGFAGDALLLGAVVVALAAARLRRKT